MSWAAAASFGGSLISNVVNAKMAAKNRKFQANMSNTAHQREVADLRKAGLNPILSAKLGGASTPPGNVATMENSAKAGVEAYNQTKLIKEQVNNIRADTNLKTSQARLAENNIDLMVQNMIKIQQETKNLQSTNKSVDMENVLRQMDVDMFTDAELLKNAKTLGVDTNTLKNLLNLFFKKGKK